MPHGRSFIVHDPEALVDVLPNYFNQTKFLSFVRQLNLWGFKRLTREVRGKAYYHELFLRGRPYIALRIKRHKVCTDLYDMKYLKTQFKLSILLNELLLGQGKWVQTHSQSSG